MIAFFGLGIVTVLPRMNAATSIMYSALMLLSFMAFNYWVFAKLNWVLSFTYPGLTLVMTSGAMISYKYFTEEREKKRTQDNLSVLPRPSMYRTSRSDEPEMLKLGGEKREMTVLFSDIRGFTSFSEKMPPNEVVEFLNKYFDRMTRIIFNNAGTLDKLIGDALMCFWGHPIKTTTTRCMRPSPHSK